MNTIRQFTDVTVPVNELVNRINAQVGVTENVIDLSKQYRDALIVTIVSCEKHSNADKLNVCRVDDGGVVKGVERDSDGLVQVVCGAPNVSSGIRVVWLPPGSTVPGSFHEDEPFVLGSRELRGVMSHGMIASPKELALGDNHDGILVLTEHDLPEGCRVSSLEPGSRFSAVFGFDDTIIDIENKMFTHRPDCFGVLGVAREIAGIQHTPFASPDWYTRLDNFKSGEGLKLNVSNEASRAVPRFMVAAIKNIQVGPSPVWLQSQLIRLGGKPINNIVDITNYVMLLTGQPTHAYDYDKLHGHTIGTRMAHEGEHVLLLNGKTYQCGPEDILIVDGDGPVGLAGIMGGGTSEVSAETKNIVLECANFDMYTVRRTSMKHGLFTDALTRFNKGQSPLQNDHVLSLLMRMVHDVAGGQLASQVFDVRGRLKVSEYPAVTVTQTFINSRLGLNLRSHEIISLLTNVEFKVEEIRTKPVTLKITVPFWRTDIHLAEDIVEEVGRLYGYDRLPRMLPLRPMAPAKQNESRVLKQRIREVLRRAGASEVLTYSFVHERTLVRASQNPKDAYKLANALSPDLQYYRLSVLPSLLDKVHTNIKNGFDEFILYEFGKGHNKYSVQADGLPAENDLLEVLYTNKSKKPGAAYYQAAHVATVLLNNLGLTVTLQPIDSHSTSAGLAPFDQARSAYLVLEDGLSIGIVGELKSSVLRGFKLPDYTAAFSVDMSRLLAAFQRTQSEYKPLSRFPSSRQDISLKIPSKLSYAELHELVVQTLSDKAPSHWNVDVTPLTIYQAESETAYKTVSFRVIVTSSTGTLTDDEVSALLDAVAARASKRDATRV